MEDPRIALRERTRAVVRAQLADAALRLFVAQGFEETTVEQIATTTGLSRRSFHRYFSSKEDVLGQWFAEMGQQMADSLAARPPHEPAWFALRRAFDGLISEMTARSESLAMTRMMLDTPALHASHLHKLAHWRELLADVLEQRNRRERIASSRISADALAGAALAGLEAAQQAWVAEGNLRSLTDLVDDAMAAIAPITARR